MTPLAHQILLETLKSAKERRLDDRAAESNRILEYQFFELSAVYPLMRELSKRLVGKTFGDGADQELNQWLELCFLPAQKSWLEYSADGNRQALLLSECAKGEISARVANLDKSNGWFVISAARVFLRVDGAVGWDDAFDKYGKDAARRAASNVINFLPLINTPRIIGRRQHMPHAGLQRKLAASKGMVGKFPLQGWTELKLEVRAPKVEGQREEVAYLTGGKALHFCRAHLRVRLGRLEYVGPHWRGDPSLGIKRTRYAVVPPKPGSPPPDFMRR